MTAKFSSAKRAPLISIVNHRVVRARAPLRLGLAGGGTDVSPYTDLYGGIVLNAAIDRYAHVTIERLDGPYTEFVAADQGVSWRGAPDADPTLPDALALHAGVYRRFIREFRDGTDLPLRISTAADSPPGSGLGTSSSLVVALCEAMRHLLDIPLGTYELAHLAFEIERVELKLAGGRQDQYAAAFGGFNFMEFFKDDKVVINPLRVDRRVVNELEGSLVTYFTGVSRQSASIIAEQVRNVDSGSAPSIEAMHQLKHDAVEMKEALLRGRIDRVAELLEHSWQAKKRTAANISSTSIEAAYAAAREAGALGGKVSGAGGGGFMMFLCDPPKRPAVLAALRNLGGSASPCHFSPRGAESWRIA